MKPLPMETANFKPLHDMLTGHIRSRLLRAGLALGVFDVLVTPRAADETAAQIGAHAQNTRFFLDALTNIGLIEKKEGRYRNSQLAGHYLASDAALYIGPLFRMTQAMSLDPLEDLEALVRNGPRPPVFVDDAASQCQMEESARASAPWAMGEMGNRVARIVSRLQGASHFEKMLDLGGGHGLFALYIAQANSNIQAVIFDRPAVVHVASEFIDAYAMGEQVTVMAGDYMTDDIGDGYDLVWASATLSHAKNNPDDLIAKIRNALKPNGYFISLHDGMTHEQTQPDLILEWLGSLLSSGRDVRFEQGELAGAMLRGGFRNVQSRSIETPIGAMDLDIARK